MRILNRVRFEFFFFFSNQLGILLESNCTTSCTSLGTENVQKAHTHIFQNRIDKLRETQRKFHEFTTEWNRWLAKSEQRGGTRSDSFTFI